MPGLTIASAGRAGARADLNRGECPDDGFGADGRGHPIPATSIDLLWAQLMQRSLGFDVLACPRCARTAPAIALIEARDAIRRILAHLGLPTEVPPARPSWAPPLRFGLADDGIDAP